MKNRFDQLSETLAGGMLRRDAIRWLGGGIAGALLAPLGMRSVMAQGQGQAHRTCTQLCKHVLPQQRAQCLAACFSCSSIGNLCGGPGALICCGAGTTCCGSVCTDTSVDPLNCGGCGVSCNGGTCVNGTCVSTCPSPLTVCNGVCTDTSVDPNNCGACGNVCPSALPFCVTGGCSSNGAPGSV